MKTRLAVDVAAWLSESDLLLVGRLPAKVAAGEAMRLPSRGSAPAGRASRVFVHLQVRAGRPMTTPTLRIDAREVKDKTASVQELGREFLAWLPAETRAVALEFVIHSTAGSPAHSQPLESARLSTSLHSLREALRERLPVGLSPDGPMALIDAVARTDRDAFYVRGRIRAGASKPVRVTAVSPEGGRVEILDGAYWYDLTPSKQGPGESSWKGLAAFFTCAPSARAEGWVFEIETRSGELLEVGAPKVVSNTSDVIRLVLEDLGIERLPKTSLRIGQVVPAVRSLQRARIRAVEIESVKQFGSPPRSPAVSVVVPLYRRIDLIEHQLVQFADDPGMQAVELIYVLDSPELEDELLDVARRLFPLYRQPLRVAVLSANVGFAGANNLGASIASGRLLLLLNSDVFPEAPGWLDAMVRFHDSLSNPGAVGPKLLYEDDTLQHAGMFFERLSDTQPWSNEHYFKGMHRSLPAAAKSRPVPSVTGACMLIARDLYAKMGGLSGEYVQGDFEDSDLCLRLLEAGRQNWYFANVALYHLEASSYDPERRRLHDQFNRWLHTHIWGERLSALGGSGVSRLVAPPAAKVAAVEVNGELAAAAPRGR